MRKRKNMDINLNKNIENNQENSGSEEEVATTTVTCTTTIKPEEIQTEKILYFIMLGNNLDEYYSWVTPIIQDNNVHLFDLIKKATLTEDLIDKVVEIDYCEDLEEHERMLTINLSTGIVIKTVDYTQLDWLNKDYKTAQDEFKEESLNAYRNLIPKLFQKLENMTKAERHNHNKRNPDNLIDL